MAYNNAIPQPTDKLRNSQPDLLGNFQAIKTLVDVNHVTFDVADQGKHKFVTFPVQSPAPTFLTGEEGLYNKLFNTGVNPTNINELYVHVQPSASGTRPQEIPFTASILSRIAPNTTETGNEGVRGWTYLPSGLLIKWQHVTSNAGGGLETVSSSFALSPNFNALMAVIPTIRIDQGNLDYNVSVKPVGIVAGTTDYKLYFANGAGTAPKDGLATVLLIGY